MVQWFNGFWFGYNKYYGLSKACPDNETYSLKQWTNQTMAKPRYADTNISAYHANMVLSITLISRLRV
jgi:hypothetical protein